MEPAVAVDLGALAARAAPLVLSGERTLAVPDALAELFPEGGLVRGRTYGCDGPAATSLALSLIAPAVDAGAWLAAIDLPTLGLDAAGELGVPLERIVSVHSGDGPDRARRWPEVIAAAADGFDVVIARVPPGVTAGSVRTVAARIRQRATLLMVVGDPGPVVCDAVVTTEAQEWLGLGDGHGLLCQRRLTVAAAGRRIPARRRCRLVLPGRPG